MGEYKIRPYKNGTMAKTVNLIFSGTDEVTPTMQKISGGMDQVNRSATTASGGMGLLNTALIAAAGLWAVDKVMDYAQSLTHLAAAAEDYRGKLEILMRSETAAAQTYGAMKKMAMSTPFKTDDLMDAAVRLETFGLSAQKYMLGLADAAAATKRPLMDVIQAVSMAGEGNLRGLRQYGINTLDILKQTGAQSTTELLSSEQGLQRITEATLDIMGSKFAGAAAKEAKNWDGMIIRMGNVWRGFETKIMESGLFDVMSRGLAKVLDKINQLKSEGRLDEWARDTADAIIQAFELATMGVEFFAKAVLSVKLAVDEVTYFFRQGQVDKLLSQIDMLKTKKAELLAAGNEGGARDITVQIIDLYEQANDAITRMNNAAEGGAATVRMLENLSSGFDTLRQGVRDIVAESQSVDDAVVKPWKNFAEAGHSAAAAVTDVGAATTDTVKTVKQHTDTAKQLNEVLKEQAEFHARVIERLEKSDEMWRGVGSSMSGYIQDAVRAGTITDEVGDALNRAANEAENMGLGVVEQAAAMNVALKNIETSTSSVADTTSITTGDMSKSWTDLSQNIESSMNTVFRNLLSGTASIGETIKDWFADLIAHLAATATTNRIVIPIMASIAGPLGMTTSAAGGMTGGGGIPGLGFGFNFLNQPLSTNALPAGMVGPPAPGMFGNATWGGTLGGLFGGGLTGYGMSGLPGGLFGGGLGMAGYLGGSALGLGGILGSIVPGIGTILGGIVGGLIGKLFQGEPDYWTQSKLTMPGGTGLKDFTGAAPSSMLASHWLSDTAEKASGLDTAGVQKIFDTYVGGVQTTFQSIYDSMPTMFQTAFDEMEIPAYDEFLSDEGKNVGKKLTYQMREWLSSVDFTVTQTMMDTAADVFGKAGGLDQGAINKISAAWVKRDNDFFKSLVDSYDMSSETDLDALTTEYKTYMTNFFSGISDALSYMTADPLQEILDTLNKTPIDQATDQFARFDKQINFLTESLNDLTGQEYASAIANIGTLLTERYNLEIEYITQLSSMMKGLLSGLEFQQQGYMLDMMNPEQQSAYWGQEKNRLWTEFYGESDPTKAAGLLTQWQSAFDKYWQTLPSTADWEAQQLADWTAKNGPSTADALAAKLGINVSDLYIGAAGHQVIAPSYRGMLTAAGTPPDFAAMESPQEKAFKNFQTAMDAATGKIEKDFGGAIQDVIDGHKDTAESLRALGSAAVDVAGALNAATTAVGYFIERLGEINNVSTMS